MYKRKLFFFGVITAVVVLIALLCAAITAQLTRENVKQSTIAQTLLSEHQELSSISYRLFKQFTDEVIFGRQANQSEIRKKTEIIDRLLNNIKSLEQKQREALGLELTAGSVEDTEELRRIITKVITSFDKVIQSNDYSMPSQRDQLRNLLEITIDDEFRDAINAALARQSRVVSGINARIDMLNTAVVWFTMIMAAISLPLIVYGCYWLVNQLYQPIVILKDATNTIAKGQYGRPISIKLDDEFEELSQAINKLAERLKENEKIVSESQKKLAFEVEHRTIQLTAANHELTKIDARRRQFLSDVSHELRTPLTIIRGEAQVTLRLKSAEESEYRETLKVVLDQSILLSRLVDDLLTLTRAEMDSLTLNKSTVNMAQLVQSEINKWTRLHEERKFIFEAKGDTEHLELNVDTSRIQQVLSVLLDNACKYSTKEEVITTIIESDKDFFSISIRDKGEGIPASELENIFKRFVRFSKHQEGLGLGLPIAKTIVESHDGQLKAESTKNLGSIFTIVLPRK